MAARSNCRSPKPSAGAEPSASAPRRMKVRKLTDHIVEGDSANHQIAIEVLDEPGAGGACHLYDLRGFDTASNLSDPFKRRYGTSADHSTVLFQNEIGRASCRERV